MICCIIVCVIICKRKRKPAGILPATAKTNTFKPKPYRTEIVTDEIDDLDHTQDENPYVSEQPFK